MASESCARITLELTGVEPDSLFCAKTCPLLEDCDACCVHFGVLTWQGQDDPFLYYRASACLEAERFARFRMRAERPDLKCGDRFTYDDGTRVFEFERWADSINSPAPYFMARSVDEDRTLIAVNYATSKIVRC
jgi:hypothetical protein